MAAEYLQKQGQLVRVKNLTVFRHLDGTNKRGDRIIYNRPGAKGIPMTIEISKPDSLNSIDRTLINSQTRGCELEQKIKQRQQL